MYSHYREMLYSESPPAGDAQRGPAVTRMIWGSDVEGTLSISGLAAGISHLTNKLRCFAKSSIHVSDSWCAVVCACVLHICAVSTHVCVDLYTLRASRPVYALLHLQHSRLACAVYAWFCVIHVPGNGHHHHTCEADTTQLFRIGKLRTGSVGHHF